MQIKSNLFSVFFQRLKKHLMHFCFWYGAFLHNYFHHSTKGETQWAQPTKPEPGRKAGRLNGSCRSLCRPESLVSLLALWFHGHPPSDVCNDFEVPTCPSTRECCILLTKNVHSGWTREHSKHLSVRALQMKRWWAYYPVPGVADSSAKWEIKKKRPDLAVLLSNTCLC